MSQFDFKSTTTLVTGGSSGLGVEFARQIAARGGDLVLVARTQERLDAIAEELRAKHRVELTTLPADLSEPAGVGEVIQFAANQPIKVLVNNAGFGTYGKFAELDPAREHAEIMVNVAAPVDLAHALLPGMLASRSGGIITVASTIGFQPGPGQAVYGATKAFALSFSEALWVETRGTGIRVLALCPGPTATGFLSGLGDERAASSRHLPAGRRSRHGRTGRSSRIRSRPDDDHSRSPQPPPRPGLPVHTAQANGAALGANARTALAATRP